MASHARGAHPDPELSPKTIAGLCEDGLTPTEAIPQSVSLADSESAPSIITFCELPKAYQNKVAIAPWSEVPPVDHPRARAAIIAHLNQLMNTL